MKNVTFKGKTFTTNAIKGAVDKASTQSKERQVILNVAVLQVALHGNTEWLNILFNAPTARLKNGKLSKAARVELDYVKDHCPLIQWDAKNLCIKKRKTKEGSPLNGKLSIPFTEDEKGNKTLVDAQESAGFSYDFVEWQNIKGGEEKQKAPSDKKATTLTSQLEAMTSLLNGEKENKVLGNADELTALASMAEKLHKSAVAAKIKAQDKDHKKMDEVEKTFLEQSNNVSSPKETRADTDREKHAANA